MGDRGNIVVKQSRPEDSYIYLYTHWNGSEIAETLQNALKRGKDRWDDEQYLTRIIFSEMVKDSIMDTDGFGISTYQGDNEHDFLVVDSNTQTVSRVREGDPGAKPKETWSFEKFVDLKVAKVFGYED
jgi:hypothetical protein